MLDKPVKYHISKDGKKRICKAENCPLKMPHFTDPDEADRFADIYNELAVSGVYDNIELSDVDTKTATVRGKITSYLSSGQLKGMETVHLLVIRESVNKNINETKETKEICEKKINGLKEEIEAVQNQMQEYISKHNQRYKDYQKNLDGYKNSISSYQETMKALTQEANYYRKQELIKSITEEELSARGY